MSEHEKHQHNTTRVQNTPSDAAQSTLPPLRIPPTPPHGAQPVEPVYVPELLQAMQYTFGPSPNVDVGALAILIHNHQQWDSITDTYTLVTVRPDGPFVLSPTNMKVTRKGLRNLLFTIAKDHPQWYLHPIISKTGSAFASQNKHFQCLVSSNPIMTQTPPKSNVHHENNDNAPPSPHDDTDEGTTKTTTQSSSDDDDTTAATTTTTPSITKPQALRALYTHTATPSCALANLQFHERPTPPQPTATRQNMHEAREESIDTSTTTSPHHTTTTTTVQTQTQTPSHKQNATTPSLPANATRTPSPQMSSSPPPPPGTTPAQAQPSYPAVSRPNQRAFPPQHQPHPQVRGGSVVGSNMAPSYPTQSAMPPPPGQVSHRKPTVKIAGFELELKTLIIGGVATALGVGGLAFTWHWFGKRAAANRTGKTVNASRVLTQSQMSHGPRTTATSRRYTPASHYISSRHSRSLSRSLTPRSRFPLSNFTRGARK